MLHCFKIIVVDLLKLLKVISWIGPDGTFFLSLVAEKVDGFDIDIHRSLRDGSVKLPVQCDSNLHIVDLEKLPIAEEADVCVAIELLEHLENPEFLLEHLKVQTLFFTIPCYGDRNPFHKIEYNEEKAANMVRKFFPNLTYRMEAKRMIGLATK